MEGDQQVQRAMEGNQQAQRATEGDQQAQAQAQAHNRNIRNSVDFRLLLAPHGVYLNSQEKRTTETIMSNYRRDAETDARETVLEYLDAIVEKLENDGEASDDLHNDYSGGDAWHHESHVDQWYNLLEAAEN